MIGTLFSERQRKGEPILILTAYDAWLARILTNSRVDALLVGDSVAMVLHGHPSTVAATVDLMELHVASVARGSKKPVIADLPFGSVHKGSSEAIETVERMARAGAHAVKIEGVSGIEPVIERMVRLGVPVMGHLGLTPQAVLSIGGYTVQGRDSAGAERILADARALERLGCFALVLECVPNSLGREVSDALSIPVIGIGAGPDVDGQVLVTHDLLGLTEGKVPRFVRRVRMLRSEIEAGVHEWCDAVVSKSYPTAEESYGP